VDSGIPVIVGLAPWAADQDDFHAVVAVGHTLQKLDAAAVLPQSPTRSEYSRFILVNDDQRGTNLRLPIKAGDALTQTPYNASHIVYLIVPFPGKVFTPAESAEKLSWDLVNRYATELNNLKNTYTKQLATSIKAADEFAARFAANEIIARTYLTYGWRYKQRMIRNSCAPSLKDAILRQSLPRFVWVTEFGTRASFNDLDDKNVRIFSHVVVDATSSAFWEGRCIFHAPGFVWRWYHDPAAPFNDYVNAMVPIADDVSYGIKIRGTFSG